MKIHHADRGSVTGTWVDVDDGTLCVVTRGAPGSPYVAVYQKGSGSTLPHAMHFVDGQLMLQIPIEGQKAVSIAMSKIESLIHAAQSVQ